MNQRCARVTPSLCALGIFFVAVPAHASHAYVATCCSAPSAISVINRATYQVEKTLLAGQGAGFVTLTPDGKTAYVSNEAGLDITVVDTTTGAQIATIPLPNVVSVDPFDSVLSPDGSRLYVIGYYFQFFAQSTYLFTIDTATNAEISSVPIPADYLLPLAISADGQTLYMCGQDLFFFDVATQTVTASIPLPNSPNGPLGFAVSPDRAYAVVLGEGIVGHDGQLALVDLKQMAVVKQIYFNWNQVTGPAVFSPDGSLVYFIIGNQNGPHVGVFDVSSGKILHYFPASGATVISITPDGQELELGNTLYDTALAMDTTTGAITRKASTLGSLISITVSPDGQWLYVPDYNSSMVEVIQPETGKVVSQIPAAGTHSPDSGLYVKFSDDGGCGVVTGAASLTVIDSSRGEIAGLVPVLDQKGVALSSNGDTAYVLTEPNNEYLMLQVVDTRLLKVVASVPFPSGVTASHLAVTSDGKNIYVPVQSCSTTGCVQELMMIATSSLQITGQIPLAGCYPYGNIVPYGDIALANNGSTAYVGCELSISQGGILIVDLERGQVSAAIPLGALGAPSALSLAPNGKLLYAIDNGSIVVINPQQQQVVESFLNPSSLQLAVSLDSRVVYATSASSYPGAVTVIAVPPGGVPTISGSITVPAIPSGVAFTPTLGP